MKFKELEKLINDEGVILKDYSGNEIENARLDQLLIINLMMLLFINKKK